MRNVTSERLASFVQLEIPRAALESIYDECDRYDHDETGGRMLGTCAVGRGKKLSIVVTGVIEPGPRAERTATYFQQDGDHQERVFRALEQVDPELEHLGNWHTHHVNGYPTLSDGDRETYHRIVNHAKHNTDFFYALLVTARNRLSRSGDRYSVRHFVLLRGDPHEYEIPSENVHVVDRPIIWPQASSAAANARSESPPRTVRAAGSRVGDNRVADRDLFARLYPTLKPFAAKGSGSLYWRGQVPLLDDSEVEVVVAEVGEDGNEPYAVAVKGAAAELDAACRALGEKRFESAREAMVMTERMLNRALFAARSTGRRRARRFWGGA